MAAKDFYRILGVSKGASDKEIRQAYRRLARQYHPDVNPGDKAGEERFKEINTANEVLSDAEKRRKYDKYGDQWEHADQIEAMQGRSGGAGGRFGPAGAHFEFGAGGVGDLGSIIDNLFGRRRPAGPRKGADAEHRVEVTLDEAFHGTTRTLQMEVQGTCGTCDGKGELAGAVCHVCEGQGTTRRTRRLEVKIPPGVDTGSRVRIAREGEAGAAGGRRGDLMLLVTVRADERFERKKSDLYIDIEVPVTDAVLGTEVEIPTMTGKVALTVPPLTPNGKQFRLAKQGMPKLRGKERGNLYARLRVVLPEKLSDDERKLFEELREAGL